MAGTAISAVGLTGLPGIPAASRMLRIAPRGDLSVRDLTLQHGRTEANGGAVQNSGQLTGANVTFLGNFGKHGGGLWNGPGSSADLSQSLFRHNHAVFGGAIGIAATAQLTTDGVTFWQNGASQGGAVDNASHSGVSLQQGTFLRNAATLGGALDSHAGAQLTADKVTFQGNQSPQGGAVHVTDAVVSLQDCTLAANTAVAEGTGNPADQLGGAAYVSGGGHLNIVGSALHSNRAGLGGALYVARSGHARLERNTLSHNAAGTGGAVYNAGDLTLLSDNFNANTAADRGGAIFGSSPTGGQYLTFRRNAATAGGAIYAARGLGLDSSAFFSNQAAGPAGQGDGGALYIAFSLGTSGLTMRNNRATDDGGAIYIAASVHPVSFGPPVQLAHDVIYHNQAFNPIDDRVGRGGGIYNATGNAALVTVGNNDITRNFLDNCEPAGSVPECTG
jgi:predicted outer membrane repeat protein